GAVDDRGRVEGQVSVGVHADVARIRDGDGAEQVVVAIQLDGVGGKGDGPGPGLSDLPPASDQVRPDGQRQGAPAELVSAEGQVGVAGHGHRVGTGAGQGHLAQIVVGVVEEDAHGAGVEAGEACRDGPRLADGAAGGDGQAVGPVDDAVGQGQGG